MQNFAVLDKRSYNIDRANRGEAKYGAWFPEMEHQPTDSTPTKCRFQRVGGIVSYKFEI